MNDLLQKIIGLFGTKEGGSVLGVDISSSTIKVVQLRRKRGRAFLETYGELALGPYVGLDIGKATNLPTEKMAEALADLIKESKVSTKNAGVALPLSASLINVITMPDVGERRLADMVPIELRKYIPVSISEVMIDWRIIPDIGNPVATGPDRKVDILTVAIHRDTLTRYHEIVEKAGLQTSFFEIEAFSTIRALLEDELVPVMLVDMGAGTTKIYIIDRKVLRESHIINRGSQDLTMTLARSRGISITEAEQLKKTIGVSKVAIDKTVPEVLSLVLDSTLNEAHRIMLTYQKQHNRNVGKVILSGGGVVMPGIIEHATAIFETEVVAANPFGKIQTPAFLEDVLTQVGPEFGVAVGVALRKLEEGS